MNSTQLFLFILINEILVCKAIANKTQSMVDDPNQLDNPTPDNDPNQQDDPTPNNDPNQQDDPTPNNDPNQLDDPTPNNDPNQLDDPTPNNDPNQLDDPTPNNDRNQLDDPMLKCKEEFCWPKCCPRDQLFHVDVEQCGPMPEILNK
jgi:hypothetical protein